MPDNQTISRHGGNYFRIPSICIICGFVSEVFAAIATTFVFRFNHRRCFSYRVLNAHNHAADNGVVEAEVSFQLIDRFLRRFNVQQNVVSFVQFVDWISQLTAAPVFQTVNLTLRVSDGSTVTLIMPGTCSLWSGWTIKTIS